MPKGIRKGEGLRASTVHARAHGGAAAFAGVVEDGVQDHGHG